MVGVDVDQRGIKRDRAFEEGDDDPELEGIHFRDGNRQRLAAGLVQRLSRAAQEALEVIGGGGAGLDFHALAIASLADLDEDREEIVHAVAELLDIGMLVGGTLVAINRDALVDGVAIEIERLAERLHEELLEILREQHERVLVGQHDHVLFATTVSDVIPSKREVHGGVRLEISLAGFRIHRGGTGEEGVDVDPLECSRHEADGRHDRSSSADPVLHRELRDEALGGGVGIELRTFAGDGDRVLAEIESGSFIGSLGLQHPVACLRRATGFGNDHHQGLGETLLLQLRENAVHPGRIGVVEEMNRQLRVRAEGIIHELRAEGGAADADEQELLELSARGWRDLTGVDLFREFLERFQRLGDLLSDLLVRREGGVAQPVVADHALLVRVYDRAAFQLGDAGEGLVDLRLHGAEEGVLDVHQREVDGEAEFRVTDDGLAVAGPGHGGKLIGFQG